MFLLIDSPLFLYTLLSKPCCSKIADHGLPFLKYPSDIAINPYIMEI